MGMLPIFNKDGKETSQIEISEEIFGQKVNQDVLHQAVVMYQASTRQGTASTKDRSEVSGGGKKPYRQKGTGRARQGSTRAPQFVGGGVVFGPRPRDFGYTLPKRIRRLALLESLKAKYQSGDLMFIEELNGTFEKTKDFAAILKVLNLNGKILALLEGSDQSVGLVSRNIPRFDMQRSEDATAYDVLRNKHLLLTKTAFETLMGRINK